MLLSGTVAVPGNAVAVTVLGAFGASYDVPNPSASWGPTRFQVSNQTPTSFDVEFTIPAPGEGGSLDWLVNLA